MTEGSDAFVTIVFTGSTTRIDKLESGRQPMNTTTGVPNKRTDQSVKPFSLYI